jgi:hypothetical protein
MARKDAFLSGGQMADMKGSGGSTAGAKVQPDDKSTRIPTSRTVDQDTTRSTTAPNQATLGPRCA